MHNNLPLKLYGQIAFDTLPWSELELVLTSSVGIFHMGYYLITTHGQEYSLIGYCDLLNTRLKLVEIGLYIEQMFVKVRSVNYGEKERTYTGLC